MTSDAPNKPSVVALVQPQLCPFVMPIRQRHQTAGEQDRAQGVQPA
jgi:hypothetical protein